MNHNKMMEALMDALHQRSGEFRRPQSAASLVQWLRGVGCEEEARWVEKQALRGLLRWLPLERA